MSQKPGIQDVTYSSALNNRDIPIKVYLPPGYESDLTTRYPAVYDLHGGGGSPERQWDRTRATLVDAMANRRVRPMIYVFVNGLGNSEFVNTADGLLIERSIVQELIPFIDNNYRTIASRQARAIDGFSMGGFGCLSVAFRNPEKFSAVVSYGAALAISATGKNYKNEEHFKEHDPWALVRAKTQAIRDNVRIRMVCGDSDGLYASNMKFRAFLDELRIPVDWAPVSGVAHCTQCLYEEVGIESLKFIEESFDLAARGARMDVPARRAAGARRFFGGSMLVDEPPPFRPSGPLPRLKVSDNHRFLVTEDGRPFFWLADTAWLLFQNLDREETDKYLEDRAAKQFSVVLSHILPWKKGGTNAYGERPFTDDAYAQPNEAYWKHADHIVDQAAAKGLYIGILPMWARNYISAQGKPDMQPLVTPAQAMAYGRFLGKRYGNRTHVIWVLGGDGPPTQLDILDSMAKGITDGAGGDPRKVLITYHPNPQPGSSSEGLHDRSWLDFNMLQSSHSLWRANYALIEKDYAHAPPKPVVDGEPNYEDHPMDEHPDQFFNAWHVRIKAYWSVFAGAFGFTYGGNGIWQMDRPGKPVYNPKKARLTWDQALNLSGATQMKHLRRLMESRPFLTRVPDDGTTLVLSKNGEKAEHIQVTRAADRGWAMFYLASGQDLTVNLTHVKGPVINAWWFNPRDGSLCDERGDPTDKPFARLQVLEQKKPLSPPGQPDEGNDWVLVLDDASRNYPAPGATTGRR